MLLFIKDNNRWVVLWSFTDQPTSPTALLTDVLWSFTVRSASVSPSRSSVKLDVCLKSKHPSRVKRGFYHFSQVSFDEGFDLLRFRLLKEYSEAFLSVFFPFLFGGNGWVLSLSWFLCTAVDGDVTNSLLSGDRSSPIAWCCVCDRRSRCVLVSKLSIQELGGDCRWGGNDVEGLTSSKPTGLFR
jgi:hypothetical protein